MKAAVTLILSAVFLAGCASHSVDMQPADELAREGHGLAEQGRTQAALKVLDQALVLDPQHAGARFDRGQAYLALQRDRDALADFEAALAANPANMRALYGRGVARQRLGDARGLDDQQLAVARLSGAGREFVVPALQ